MNVHYHQGKSNFKDYGLSRMRMRSTNHVQDDKKELAKHIHRLERLDVQLVYSTYGGILVHFLSHPLYLKSRRVSILILC